jgi:Ca2+-binding EF-hand superfamily protein
MKKLLTLVCCIALAGTVEAAKPKNAKKPGKGGDAAFKKVDTNNDGIITPREFGAISKDKNVGKAFAKLDKDKSGSLLPSEFSAYKPDADQAKKKKKK